MIFNDKTVIITGGSEGVGAAAARKFAEAGANLMLVARNKRNLETIAEELRDKIAGIRIEMNLGGGSFKSQMKRADKSNAVYALILGEQELSEGRIGIKPLRNKEEQESVALDELAATLGTRLN